MSRAAGRIDLDMRPHSSAALVGVLLVLGAACSAVRAQTPSHVYDLNGTYADALGGPALTPQGGTLGATGYSFGGDQGPSLTGALPTSVYSIEMQFRIDDVSGYRSLINFKDLGTDNGLYNQGGFLRLYQGGNIANSPAAVFSNNTLAHLILTRDAANTLVGYVDGVEAFTFADASGTATFTGPGNVGWFLNDNSGEEPSGFLDYIRVYDAPLTQAQVTERFNNRNAPFTGAAVPEAGTLPLVLGGFLGAPALGFVARRRRAR
jgi:hypothetical protein